MITSLSSTIPPASSTTELRESPISNLPLTSSRSSPLLTKSESDFPPRIRFKAVKTMVLPAPVSPLITVRPDLNSISAVSITPRFLIVSSRSELLTIFGFDIKTYLQTVLRESRRFSAPTFNRQLEFGN